jgi:hypothetical protein
MYFTALKNLYTTAIYSALDSGGWEVQEPGTSIWGGPLLCHPVVEGCKSVS